MAAKQQSYLGLLLDLVTECFTADVAERVVGLQVAPAVLARVERLAEKANEGKLSDEERAEYEEFVEAADLLAILQVKARGVLERQES
jgi:hypothetical protein